MSESPVTDKRLEALVASATGIRLVTRKKKSPEPFAPPLSVAWIMNHTRWAYWQSRGRAFCYNTIPMPKMAGNKNRQWAAWKMRVNYDKNLWTPLGNAQFFALRRVANQKAYAWFMKAHKKEKAKEATASVLCPECGSTKHTASECDNLG